MQFSFRTKQKLFSIVVGLCFCAVVGTVQAQVDWKNRWERSVQEAKKEGMIVVGIPARAELRKELEAVFKPKFSIEMDLSTARGPQNASKIAAEFAAGIKNFDVFIGGSGTYESLVESGMTEPLDTLMILPEVKEAKNWWGGHIWEDNVSTNRFLYSFIADAGTGGFWYNTKLAKPDEIRSLDDLLKPKWKGKVGFLDPRTPGSGQSIWSFLWDIKGESYLKKLVGQDLFISRDQRQLGDALARCLNRAAVPQSQKPPGRQVQRRENSLGEIRGGNLAMSSKRSSRSNCSSPSRSVLR
jgi:iron(III) transport system substrate-binding protein